MIFFLLKKSYTLNQLINLQTLYAQSWWITLALLVLPRLLARDLPGLFLEFCLLSLFYKYNIYKKTQILRFTAPINCLTRFSAFFPHAIWLDQACAQCPRFLTAAFRRSMGLVSVPLWLYVLSDQLRIIGLGSFYLSNYLILHRLIFRQFSLLMKIFIIFY